MISTLAQIAMILAVAAPLQTTTQPATGLGTPPPIIYVPDTTQQEKADAQIKTLVTQGELGSGNWGQASK